MYMDQIYSDNPQQLLTRDTITHNLMAYGYDINMPCKNNWVCSRHQCTEHPIFLLKCLHLSFLRIRMPTLLGKTHLTKKVERFFMYWEEIQEGKWSDEETRKQPGTISRLLLHTQKQ